MACAVAGEMNTALEHQNISNMVQKCEEGLVFRNLVCFFPKVSTNQDITFPTKFVPFIILTLWSCTVLRVTGHWKPSLQHKS